MASAFKAESTVRQVAKKEPEAEIARDQVMQVDSESKQKTSEAPQLQISTVS